MLRILVCLIAVPLALAWPPGALGASPMCAGDCDGDGQVTVEELVAGAGLLLGTAPSGTCPAFEADGAMTASKLVQAIGAALGACSADQIVLEGLCERPGAAGLEGCPAGTDVRGEICADPSTCVQGNELPEVIDVGPVDAGGRFLVLLSADRVGGEILLFEADVAPETTDRALYVGFAAASTAAQSSAAARLQAGLGGVDVLLGPVSEATVRVLDAEGLENFGPQGMDAVAQAVARANEGTDFAGLGAEAAAVLATEVALGDSEVQEVVAAERGRIRCLETIRGAISAPFEVDRYEFVGLREELVAISVHRLEQGAFTPCWELRRPDGVREDIPGNASDISCGGSEVILNQSGRYAIRVFDRNAGPSVGSYEVRLEPRSRTLGGEDTCAPAIGCGSVVEGRPPNPSAAEVYRLDGLATQVLAVSTLKVSGEPGFLPCWTVRRQSGARVDVPGDADDMICNGRAELALPADGIYTIVVADRDRLSSGTFELRVEPRSATLGLAPASCAAPIACNQLVTSTLPTVLTTNTFQFEGLENDIVAVAVSKGDGAPGFNPCWSARRPNGTLEDIPGDADDQVCGQRAAFRLQRSGVYTVVVGDDGVDATGSFNLRLEPRTATLNQTHCAEPISCGFDRVDSIDVPQLSNTLRFEGASGQQITVSALKEGGLPAFTPCWSVLNAAGAVVDIPGVSSDIICNGARGFPLGTTGTHTIVVWDGSGTGSNTGSYRFQLTCE